MNLNLFWITDYGDFWITDEAQILRDYADYAEEVMDLEGEIINEEMVMNDE